MAALRRVSERPTPRGLRRSRSPDPSATPLASIPVGHRRRACRWTRCDQLDVILKKRQIRLALKAISSFINHEELG